MEIKLTGGEVYDPVHQVNGDKKDLYIVDGKLQKNLTDNKRLDNTFDLSDCIVMAGAIDLHTHIGGGKVNIARTMMLEDAHSHHTQVLTSFVLAMGARSLLRIAQVIAMRKWVIPRVLNPPYYL